MEDELIENLEPDFKPEARSAGRALFAKGVVSVSRPSETEAQGFVRSTSPTRVVLKSPSVGSSVLTASCSCPLGKKEQLCKHVWATLLQLAKTNSDFLEGKSEIVSGRGAAAVKDKAIKKEKSQAQIEASASLKQRQSEYRKEQYQKQKQRLKGKEGVKAKPSRFAEPELPDDIQEVLTYFADNGFPMQMPLQVDAVNVAKKKLSRVFHPDKGGTHEEILVLNRNCEVLLEFISTL